MSLPKPYYEDSAVTIYHGDCHDILPQLPKVDLVLTDPPYGLGKEGWAGGPKWGHFNHIEPDWDKVISSELIDMVIGSASQAIIWGGHLYPLPVSRAWLIWDKQQRFTGAEAELAWTNLDIPVRVYRLSRVEAYSGGKEHPTEKPTSLMAWCLSLVPEANLILDPFAGSGTTGRAAKDLGRKAILIEIEERYCEIAARRMAQMVMPL